jgi:hypothetical protein
MRLNPRLRTLAAVLSLVSVPAFAVDMPDAGTKNFSPPNETPSYFTNETGRAPPSHEPASAEDQERDMAAPIPTPGPEVSPSRHAAGHFSGRGHGTSVAHGKAHHGKSARAGRYGGHVTHAGGKKQAVSSHHGGKPKSATAGTKTKSKVTKSTKQTKRHA